MNKTRLILSILSILAVLPFSFASAQEDRLQVVASHTILADVVANVAGDAADVHSLMPTGADPHSFSPTPADLAGLSDADVVFVNGAFFEEGLLETIENAGENVNIVEASANVSILPFGVHDHADEFIEPLGILSEIECGHHEAEEEAHVEAEHEHEEGGCDPHVWWDINNVIAWVGTIRDTLSELDPANAETYAANADSYTAALETLRDDEIAPLIETIPAEQRVLVTDHDSLGYFAHAYGFEIVGMVVPGGSTVAESSASEIGALIDTIREQGVSAIFVGTTVSPVMSEQIAGEAGAQAVVLYTDSLSDAGSDAGTYIDFMRYNVQTIVNALS